MNHDEWAIAWPTKPKKQLSAESAEIAELTAQFLAAGGKITYCDQGAVAVEEIKHTDNEKQQIATQKSVATRKGQMTAKQRRFYDSIKRVALGGKFNVRELAESMRDTSYTEAKDMCKSLMAKYLVTLDGDNGELL